MLVVGLTGGIGAGKSTLAALLAERGATVIDADQLGRDALKPDARAWHAVVSQFGREILAPGTMEIDRRRLASIVFEKPGKLAALNAIVHPVILEGVARRLDRLRGTDAIVVIDAALIFETGLDRVLDVLVAVGAPSDMRAQRLEEQRGMLLADVHARMQAQMDPGEVERRAEVVVHNDGSLEALAADADRVWSELQQRREQR
jgi:dephospho-CoA kinase